MTYHEFRLFAQKLDGKCLETITRKKQFMFNYDTNAFIYTPLSTGKPRKHYLKFVERVFNRYSRIRSLKVNDYKDISKNASYLLVLIKLGS